MAVALLCTRCVRRGDDWGKGKQGEKYSLALVRSQFQILKETPQTRSLHFSQNEFFGTEKNDGQRCRLRQYSSG